jgi:hypothetical protein
MATADQPKAELLRPFRKERKARENFFSVISMDAPPFHRATIKKFELGVSRNRGAS